MIFFEEISAIWELFPAMITKINEFNVSTNSITKQKSYRIFTIFSSTPKIASSILYFPLRVTFHVLSLSYRIIFSQCSDKININGPGNFFSILAYKKPTANQNLLNIPTTFFDIFVKYSLMSSARSS